MGMKTTINAVFQPQLHASTPLFCTNSIQASTTWPQTDDSSWADSRTASTSTRSSSSSASTARYPSSTTSSTSRAQSRESREGMRLWSMPRPRLASAHDGCVTAADKDLPAASSAHRLSPTCCQEALKTMIELDGKLLLGRRVAIKRANQVGRPHNVLVFACLLLLDCLSGPS